MRHKFLLLLLAFLFRLHSASAQSTIEQCDPDAAQAAGYLIKASELVGDVPASVSRMFDGVAFSSDRLREIEEQVTANILKGAKTEFVKLRIPIVTAKCIGQFPSVKSVRIRIQKDAINIPFDESAANVLDEGEGYPARDRSEHSAYFRLHRNEGLGNAAGFTFLFRDGPEDAPDPNSLARGYFSAWMSTTRPRYYRVALGVYGLENNVRKQMRGGVIFGFSEERVPHRGGILARLSTNMGAHVDWYPRNLTIRYVPGAYRFSFVGLDQSRRAEHAVESSLDIEQRMSAGFLRLGSEGSYTLNKEHFRNLQLFSRLYLDLPVRPITGFTLDASVRWGMVTSSAPLSARFGGGQRPDPFTANPTDIDGTFAPLAGPIMRGYGMSTDALWGTDVQGRESYSGLSLTISLPGISRPTVRGVDASDRARVRNIVQTQFDNTVTAMVEQGAKRGLSDKQAVAEGTRRGLELRDTLMSVLAHGRRVVLRPLLVLDAASISPVNPLYNRLAKSVGGGVRLNGLHQNLDVLWLRNIDPLSATLGFKTRVWTIRYLVGGSFAD